MGTTEARLHVRLLGTFDVYRGNNRIDAEDWDQQKTASLLKFLLLHRDEIIPADRLIDALYPDSEPERVRKNLSGRISRLRQLLEPELERGPDSRYLQTVKDGYRFTGDGACWVDVEAFQTTFREAESLRESQRWGRAITAYREALDLYGGELLPEDPYEEWTLELRERLRDRCRQAREGLAVCHLRLEQYPQAIEQLDRLLDEDPTRESAVRWLMLAHHFRGSPENVRATYERHVETLHDQLGAQPSKESQDLFARIERGKVAPPERLTPHNLPQPISRFVGREDEIAQVTALIGQERLVTLTGVGGTGKTRLAIEVAERCLSDFPDGVWLLDLSHLDEQSQVGRRLLQILALAESQRRTPFQIAADHLNTRRALLILDNCEHLSATCAQLASDLLERCPHLTVMATSRTRLGLAGERVWRVPPLEQPDDHQDPERLRSCDAVRLFIERVRSVRPDFRLSRASAAPVATICRRLDGLPLALELAAARGDGMAVGEIAQRLDDRFRLLDNGHRPGMSRPQTLRATMDWSYDLLSDAERGLLARVSVFIDGFTLEAAERVCSDVSIDEGEVADGLAGLVTKSLVRFEGERYRLLETVRAYAHEKLAATDDVDTLRAAHFRYYDEIAQRAKNRVLDGCDPLAVAGDVQRKLANFRTAFRWAMDRNRAQAALVMAANLEALWVYHQLHEEGHEWFERALADLAFDELEPSLQAQVQVVQGVCVSQVEEFERGKAMVEAGLARFRELEDDAWIAQSLMVIGKLVGHHGRFREAAPYFAEAVHRFRDLGHHGMHAAVLNNLGACHLAAGDLDRAVQHLQASLRLGERHDLFNQYGPLSGLGSIAYMQGDLERAMALFSEALDHARRNQNGPFTAGLLSNLGELRRVNGDLAEAEDYGREALRTAERARNEPAVAEAKETLGRVLLDRGEIDSGFGHLAKSLQIRARLLGRAAMTASSLEGLARAALLSEDPKRAARLCGAADQILTDQGITELPAFPEFKPSQDEHDEMRQSLQQQLGQADLETAWAAGQELSLEEAVELALGRPCPESV